MNLHRISEKLMPPALAWRVWRRKREREEMESFRSLYRHFLGPSDLCFDIGANLGNRTRCFRALGCRVVAVEPQPECQKKLHSQFGRDSEVTLLPMVVAANQGKTKLHISPDHVLSSISEDFIASTQSSGRFSQSTWNQEIEVEATTLDHLIEQHGMPAFIKIDVEGAEPQVLAGLSQAVPALSIEWTPEMPENALTCIEKLESLGDYQYNISWAETMRFSARGWRDADTMRRLVEEFAGETFLFGDIYAQRR